MVTLSGFSGIYTGNGNRKLGKKVGVINRMPGTTCPGKSDLCYDICYALKGMFVFQHARYQANTIQLPDTLPAIFRLHAAGDFDSVEYVDACIDMVRAYPDTKFWAYTRSWRVPELLDALQVLQAEPNVQLFASIDNSMPETPPTGWRVASLKDTRYPGMVCLEEAVKDDGSKKYPGMTCVKCTYCFRKPKGHVTFLPH